MAESHVVSALVDKRALVQKAEAGHIGGQLGLRVDQYVEH
jgi:hypothetical protein